jgi:hypothetical protein
MASIKVQIRSVYGKDINYPACPAAVTLAEIAGTKTLTDETLRLIRKLGYGIEVEQPRVTLAA